MNIIKRWITKLLTPSIIITGIVATGISLSGSKSLINEEKEWQSVLSWLKKYAPMTFQSYDHNIAWEKVYAEKTKNLSNANSWQENRSWCIKTLNQKIKDDKFIDDNARAKLADDRCLVLIDNLSIK